MPGVTEVLQALYARAIRGQFEECPYCKTLVPSVAAHLFQCPSTATMEEEPRARKREKGKKGKEPKRGL